MDVNIILSEKGKQLLVVNNYKYSFQKCLKSGERRWICINKKCKSFILSLGQMENITVTKHIKEHCHNANIEKLNRQIVNSSCKRKAVEDLSEKPAKIIRRVLQDNLPSTITTCDVAHVRRNMYNARRMMQPALPKNIEETFDSLEDTNIETNTGGEHECYLHSYSDLESLVNRLEVVTEKLEAIAPAIPTLTTPSPSPTELSPTLASKKSNMSVVSFQDILQGPFATYLVTSQQIGGDVASHCALVECAFQAQLQYLVLASQCKAPATQSEQMALLQPTSQHISAIQDFREKHRTSSYFNHLSAISESIPALGWVTVSPAPAPFVKEMNDAGQFYTNRVLKDWKEKDAKHIEWVRAWVQTLADLQAFVKHHHTTGLVWAGKNAPSAGVGVPPPPPPGCPPPPPANLLGDVAALDISNDRSALFAEINQGENITRNLKKVTSDMQTHKNPTLRTGPAPFKAPQSTNALSPISAPIDKSPVFNRDGKKWLIEYQKGNHNLLVENAEMNNVVYLFKCVDSTVAVKGKINSITLDSCKKTSLVFDSVVSAVEFINCQSVQMQVFGKVPTISVDKTDGCQMYLSPDSLEVEIISSKSSEMNVLVPKGNGDYTEFPLPEQFKTTVSPAGLNTIAVESKG